MKKVKKSSVAIFLLAIVFLAWVLWLSPSNPSSPLISKLYTKEGELSVFRKDIFGRIYFYHASCHELGCSERNFILEGETVDDFIVLSREYAKSSHRVYKGDFLGGKMPNISYFDALTFEVLRDEYPEITRDKYHVYYNTFHWVWGVEDTSKFVRVSPEIVPEEGHTIDWYKDDNHVYFQGVIVKDADPATIELLPPISGGFMKPGGYQRAKDKYNVYDASVYPVDTYVGSCSSVDQCTSDLRVR